MKKITIGFLVLFCLINPAFGFDFEDEPWGSQNPDYKKQMSLIKKQENGDYELTYKQVHASRIPSKEEVEKLWTGSKYEVFGTSSAMKELTAEELPQYPGLKQYSLLLGWNDRRSFST
ncbi:MAG: hypothetical protein AB8G05_19500 [Oligoflexales bacterium]